MMRSLPVEPRFWKRVDRRSDDECWPWTGSAMVKGYGVLSVEGRQIGTHRISWELYNGPIPSGMLVCHHCDNPPCVNPAHLFLGTYSDNAKDKSVKGRNPGNRTNRGGQQFALTGLEAEALSLLANGMTQRDVARHFGISPAAVCRWRKAFVA